MRCTEIATIEVVADVSFTAWWNALTISKPHLCALVTTNTVVGTFCGNCVSAAGL